MYKTSILPKLLDYLEDNMMECYTLDDLQDYMNISKYYLDRYFTIMTGYTIFEYVRNRILYLASLDLLNTNEDVARITFKYQYDSYESFIKAFKKRYDLTPAKFRKSRPYINKFSRLMIEISVSGGDELDYEIIDIPETKIIGFEYILPYDNIKGSIPKVWMDFKSKYSNIDGKNNKELNEAIIKNNIGRYGIGINIKEGNTFKYVIGGKYMGGPIPRGLKIITFDACKAIKFNGFGQFPTAVESLHYEITHRWIYNHSNMIFDYKYQAIIFTKIDEVNYNISIIIPLKNNE